MFLELKKLTKIFKENTAVKDLTLEIEQGELVSILGPSGCGKTTTLRMIGGFLKPDYGSILLEGEDITACLPEDRPTATVFQSYALFPNMSVFQNIMYGFKFRKITKEKAKEEGIKILETVGMAGYQNKEINKLSGGEQQRIALARSLVLNPKLLLLDEPLSNLDAKLRIKMRKELKSIQKILGVTTIYVTHDQEEAMSISDRIVVLNKGKVEQIGTPESIYFSPNNYFVADFIGRTNNFFEKNIKKRIVIRPEHIKVNSQKGEYKGEIQEKLFMGSFVIYFIKIGKNIVQVDTDNYVSNHWEKGDQVYISLNKEKIIDFS